MYFDETAWVAVAFIIFIALIWKKASNAIVSILDNRSLLIHNELNEAKSLKEEALEELRKSLQTQKQVSEEAENIIRDAKETAKKIQEEAYSKSSDLIKRKEEQARQKIIALETDAIKNIKKILAICWGMQVAVTAAGGTVKKSKNGAHIGIASNIEITENGLKHPLYLSKNKKFNSPAFNFDEVVKLPEKGICLASNKVNKVQSLYFEINQTKVWGLQYLSLIHI